VPPGACLDDLAREILHVFNMYDDEHAYDFQYRDRRGKRRRFNHPWLDEGPYTTGIGIGELELTLKSSMHFTFDYGDYWEFDVLLEGIDLQLRASRVTLLESAGKSPDQYPKIEE